MHAHAKDPLLDSTRPRRILFVASTGGHLAQLKRISGSLNPAPGSLWVTFDSPQTDSLLAHDEVLRVPYVKPRDFAATFKASRIVAKSVRKGDFDLVVSTGAALAVAVLPLMRVKGIPAYYIESVSRTDGPSLTGRILAASRLVSLRTQHERWATKRWRQFPAVLSRFESAERSEPPALPMRIFVTLGTIRPYRFDAVVDQLLASGMVNEHTVWQLGETSRNDLPGTAVAYMKDADFAKECDAADVVVTHAGVGTILALLEKGIHPVVVPRRRDRGEHVDDHQEQIAQLTSKLQIAQHVEADGNVRSAIEQAAVRRVVHV
ncbi:hypothetical protein CBF90_14435 [Microbacterium sp. AISO3]|uniref:glycosyltransferase n=1 Tax=Microbacterium sp. AISO3 TaxID=2002831 RepID=UPI000B4D0FD1|nr:glycosyltransferase [Microbacterium sp. AISO3]OWP20263.1 hypothetical protein CBF90_17970 [Microbacterium sp. AISO3]OWP20911.1 hypothetical protein CBF90_14435 [Microbacterium sp. AISO3]